LKTGVGLVGANVMVGSVPNITGTTTEAGLKTNFAKGTANAGKMLPAYGKIKGTQMLIKPFKQLKKKGKSLIKRF